jgi:2-keto-4-pentenoate hydratase
MAEAELVSLLVGAQRSGTHTVDASLYAALDRPAAYRVQLGVMGALGQRVGMLKTGVHSDGVGVVAPIYAGGVGQAPGFRLPVANVIGLEVEVGVQLAKPVLAGASEADIRAAIAHYFVGVEICGTRFADRSRAGPNGGLADNMSSLGYAIGPTRNVLADTIDGLAIRVAFDGTQIYDAPAKHGFGTVLASLVAYARAPHPSFPLAAGTMMTTGSLCGLVPTSGTGHVVAALGQEALEFDIV